MKVFELGDPLISNIFFKTDWPIKTTVYVESPWGGGTKVYINDLSHMTEIAAVLICGKTFKNYFRMSNDLETWHGAFWTRGLQILYK